MARLSDPDAALAKIETLYEKVEGLFETIDLIGTLKDRFQTAADRMSEREAGLLAQIERNRELESTFVGALDRVDDLRKEASDKAETLLDTFRARAQDIADALAGFRSENEELEEERALLESELSRFSLLMEGTQEAVETLKAELKDFRDGVRKDLAAQFDALKADQSEAAETAARELGKRFQEETAAIRTASETARRDLSDRFDGEKSAMVQALSEIREEGGRMGDRFRQTLLERADEIDQTTLARLAASEAELAASVAKAEEQIETALASLMERQRALETSVREAVETRLDEHIDKFAQEAGNRKAQLDQNLAALQEERTAFQAMGQDLTEKTEALKTDVESRLAKAATDAEAAVNAEAERIAGLVSEAEGKIDGLTGELERLKTDAATGVAEAEKTLERRQTEFEESIRGEIAGRVSGEVVEIRQTHNELAASLREEMAARTGEMTTALAAFEEKRCEVDAVQERLHEAMSELTAFKDQVNKQVDAAVASLEERGAAAAAASRQAVEKAIQAFSDRGEKERAALEKAKSDFDAALKVRADKLETAVDERLSGIDEKIADREARIDEALAAVKRTADERGAALAGQVRKVLMAERQKVKDAGETAAAEASARSDELTALMAGTEEQIARLSRDMDDFRERVEADVRGQMAGLEARQAEMEKGIEEAISARLSEETTRLEASLAAALEEKIEAAVGNAAGEKDGLADIKSYIQKLAAHTQKTRQIQNEQTKKMGDRETGLANLEKRLGRIETLLSRRKKTAGNAGKGGETPPPAD